MNNAIRTPVIWVGAERSETFNRLAEILQLSGVDLEIVRSTDQVLRAVERLPSVVVIAHDDKTRLGLDATLAALERVCRPVTVVAIMDEPAFGRCYELMGRGVKYCYGLDEGPERIARAVQHSAARAA